MQIPIVCICNDKYSQKLKSLRNHCLELEFRRPDKRSIAKRMADICRGEGLTIGENSLEAIIEAANQDIRLVLGQLQMVRLRTQTLSYDQVGGAPLLPPVCCAAFPEWVAPPLSRFALQAKAGSRSAQKDMEMSPFAAAQMLLASDSAKIPLRDRAELVFQVLDLPSSATSRRGSPLTLCACLLLDTPLPLEGPGPGASAGPGELPQPHPGHCSGLGGTQATGNRQGL